MKRIHNVDIIINGETADITSPRNINLRYNVVLPTPEKIETITTSYSYSFTLPMTPKNNKIFDYANNLSKRNKFNKKYNCIIDVDHLTIFKGYLVLSSISKEKGYTCNVYQSKVNTVESIFGDSTLSELPKWFIDYDVANTMNTTNASAASGVLTPCIYPLVSYGMFNKLPKDTGFYTSKHVIDEYNRFYMQNFYPSLNLLEVVKRCFEYKGLQLQGDILDDDDIKYIYMSTNLADGQDPPYNYGLDKIGKCNVHTTFTTKRPSTRGQYSDYGVHTIQDLPIPMFKVGKDEASGNTVYNWDSIHVYDIWSQTSDFQTTTADNKYLFRDNMLVAPVSGFYKIDFDVEMDISNNTPWEVTEYINVSSGNSAHVQLSTRRTIPPNDWRFYPCELHLIKNEDDNNIYPIFPTTALENNHRAGFPESGMYNTSAFPHEKFGSNVVSTTENPYPLGYIPQRFSTLNFDPRNSEKFVMGASSVAYYQYGSVMKNGRSWDESCDYVGQTRFKSPMPYMGLKTSARTDGNRGTTVTPEVTRDYGENSLPNAQTSISGSSTNFTCKIQAIVYLEKNDRLQLKLMTRNWNITDDYTDYNNYDDTLVNVTADIMFRLFGTPDVPIDSDKMNWNTETLFDTQLNLINFLNKDEKISDFINNFIKEFNLSFSRDENVVTLNSQKVDDRKRGMVDLTDRTNEDMDIETEQIEFPQEYGVKYSIDTDERGFYNSVPFDKLELDDWKDYGDYGSDIIINDYIDTSSTSVSQLKTSYNWYDTFTHNGSEWKLASIAKDEWMIDGYKDEEMMKKDGYGLKRRYWYPSSTKLGTLVVNNEVQEEVDVYSVRNSNGNLDLSYKFPKNEDTLLSRFFNTTQDTSISKMTVECYLTTEEFLMIKNGSKVRIDDSLYIVTSIDGYDPYGFSKTKLTLVENY